MSDYLTAQIYLFFLEGEHETEEHSSLSYPFWEKKVLEI